MAHRTVFQVPAGFESRSARCTVHRHQRRDGRTTDIVLTDSTPTSNRLLAPATSYGFVLVISPNHPSEIHPLSKPSPSSLAPSGAMRARANLSISWLQRPIFALAVLEGTMLVIPSLYPWAPIVSRLPSISTSYPAVCPFALCRAPNSDKVNGCSGLVNPHCVGLIGNGVVVHLPSFFAELDKLTAKGMAGELPKLERGANQSL